MAAVAQGKAQALAAVGRHLQPPQRLGHDVGLRGQRLLVGRRPDHGLQMRREVEMIDERRHLVLGLRTGRGLRDAGRETVIFVLDAEVEYYGALSNRVNAMHDSVLASSGVDLRCEVKLLGFGE